MPQYQGVWTLEQQAQAQSNQQWVTDPNFKNTTLLLQADGTGSGSQNQTFLDGSTNNFFITRNGNTTQGSFSPFSQAPGYWSVYLNGSSSLDVASNAVLAMGTGDFTYEAWLCDTATPPNSSNPSHVIGVNSVGGGVLRIYDTGVDFNVYGVPTYFTYLVTRPIGTWYHLAYTRSGTTGRLFFNGALVATGTDSTNYSSSTNCIIGSNPTTGQFYTGYVSNARAIKGTALYTSSFTPQTTPLTAVSGTSLLTSQSNRFVDNSTNALAITVRYSAPSVQAFGPFAPALQWTSNVVGGSGYFDGSSDYLSLASNANLTPASSTYTFECWVYRTTSGAMTIWDTSVTSGFYIHINGSNKVVLRSYGTADIITSSLSAPVNAWFSVIVARGAANSTKMWINGSSSDGGSATDSTTYVAGTTYIGIYDASTVPLTGYIAGMRLVKGSDVYGVSNSTITVPTTPPTAITNTQLLLNYTNAGIYDGKMANVFETVGDAQVSTSVFKYGSGSIYLDGTGDYLTTPANPAFRFGSADFTIEAWVFITYVAGSGYYNMAWHNNGSSSSTVTGSTRLPLNTWTHIAWSKTGTSMRFFINGVLDSGGVQTVPAIIYNNADPLRIGYGADHTTAAGRDFCHCGEVGGTQNKWFAYFANGGSGNYYGYIDDFRITTGVARYIANFTPPQQALPRQ